MSGRRQSQVQELVKLSLDTQGRVSAEQVAQVMAALDQLRLSGKAELRRAYTRSIRQLAAQQIAVVQSATELDASTKAVIEQRLAEQHPSVTTIDWQIAPEVLGGVTIQAGDTWYDLSLKGKLHTIEEHLAS